MKCTSELLVRHIFHREETLDFYPKLLTSLIWWEYEQIFQVREWVSIQYSQQMFLDFCKL